MEDNSVNKEVVKLTVFPEQGEVCRGEESDVVVIIKIILNSLKLKYDGYDFCDLTCKFDDETENAVKHFQDVHGMEPTGTVDADTWNTMANEYAIVKDTE